MLTTTPSATRTAPVGPALPSHIGVAMVIWSAGIALRRAFPTSLWVKGEISDYRPHSRGHHYFNLVERLEDGFQAVLPCAIWKSNWPMVQKKFAEAGITLTSGQEMLFHGSLQLYSGTGRLTFNIADVSPEFTLGQIEAQRRAVLARLERENLIGLNQRMEMPAVPLRVAVLSSRNAAGLQDFQEMLVKSGYAFSVVHCEVPVQGPQVEQAVCRTLEILGLKQNELKLDAICIIRGGGSSTDLGWWNSYAICASIARMPIPVITGIGHERDRVAADEVAHQAVPTPTAAAEFLCSLARNADFELRETTNKVVADVTRQVGAEEQAVGNLRRSITQTTTTHVAKERLLVQGYRDKLGANAARAIAPHVNGLRRFLEDLRRNSKRSLMQENIILRDQGALVRKKGIHLVRVTDGDLIQTAENLNSLVLRRLRDQNNESKQLTERVDLHANAALSKSQVGLAHLSEIVQAYDPAHVLRRGFSITLNAEGKAIKAAGDLAIGETITTRLLSGQIASTITQTRQGN